MLRKKWLSLLVACAMIAAMMPTAAFAADGDVNPDATTNKATAETAKPSSDNVVEFSTENSVNAIAAFSNIETKVGDENTVAAYDNVHYDSLQDAVNAAVANPGGSISLWQDVTLTTPITISQGQTVKIEGHGKKIIMSGIKTAFNDTTVSPEGLQSDITLQVNEVQFVGSQPDTAFGYAAIIGDSSGVTVTFTNCTFTDLFSAVYCNQVMTAGDPNTVTVTGSTFDNVNYSYSVDDGSTPGAHTDMHVFQFSENTAAEGQSVPEAETFAVAEVGGIGYTDLSAAVKAAEEGETKTVTLRKDVELNEMLNIGGEDVTLDLADHTITADEGFNNSVENESHLINVTGQNVIIANGELVGTAKSKHGVNVYGGSVKLDGVSIDVSENVKGTPLVVNGANGEASATLAGNVTLKGAGYFAVDLDKNHGISSSLKVEPKAGVTLEGTKVGIMANSEDVVIAFGDDSSLDSDGTKLYSQNDTKVEGLDNIVEDPAELGMVARVDGVDYASITEAISAVENAEAACTLTLYEDVALTAPIQVPQGAKLTVNGNGHYIKLPAAQGGYASTAFSYNGSPEGLLEGTELTVNDVKFQGVTEGTASGFAVMVSDDGGVVVTLTGCEFNDLYTGVYCQAIADEKVGSNTIKIENGKFSDTVTYAYSVDNRTGYRTDKHDVTVTYAADSETKPGAETFAVASVKGVGYQSLTDAITNAGENGTVTLMSDVMLGDTLVISTNGLTLDLDGHTILGNDAAFGTANAGRLIDVLADGVTIKDGTLQAGKQNKHTLNLYEADNTALDNLTLDGSNAGIEGAPLILNASSATLTGNTVVKTNKDTSWYGINVDSKDKVGSTLTVKGLLKFVGENINNAGIWVEDQEGAGSENLKVVFDTNIRPQGNGDPKFEVIHVVRIDDKPTGTVEGAEGLLNGGNGSYYAIVDSAKPSEETTSSESSSTTTSSTTTTTQSGATIPYYTCKACGYHNWTATADGYKCDHCGYIESVKQLSGYGNVKGFYEPKTSSAAAQSASGTTATSAIPQTSDESNPMLWAFLLMISGGALASLAVFKKKEN